MSITSAGKRRDLVRLQNPGPPVPDGEGGYTLTWTDLIPPTLYVRVDGTPGEQERQTHATVVAGRSLTVTGPIHPGVTTHTRILFGARVLQVAGIDLQDRQMVMTCIEAVEPAVS